MYLWLDESYSYFMSQQSIRYILKNLDFHPPLYYLILKIWIMLFGDSIIAMRSLSILIGILVVIVSVKIFRLYNQDKLRATFFALAIILNTTFLYHTTQIRQYILGLLFVMLAVYQFLKGKDYSVPMALALYTHYLTAFAFVPFIIDKKRLKRFAFALILFVPYFLVVAYQIQHRMTAQDWYGKITLNTLFSVYYNYVAQIEFFNSWFIIGLILFVTLAYLSINIISFYRNREVKYYILLYYFLVPFAYVLICVFTRSIFHPRYFFFLNIFFLIPVFATKLKVAYLLVLLLVISEVIAVNYFLEQDYELRDISRHITEHREADVIVTESPMALLPVMYYTRDIYNLTYILVPSGDITAYGGDLIRHLEEKGLLEISDSEEIKKIKESVYYLQSESYILEGKKVLELKGISLILSS